MTVTHNSYYVLHKALSASQEAVTTNWLPCYSKEFINSQNGIRYVAYSFYQKAVTVLHVSVTTCQMCISFVAYTVGTVANWLFGWAARPIYKKATHYNQIRDERVFSGGPHCLERFIGYLSHGIGEKYTARSFKLLEKEGPSISEFCENILTKLTEANKNLLRTQENDYRLTVVEKPQILAYAYPNGQMVACTGLVEEMQNYLTVQKDSKAKIALIDGAKLEIDLSGVEIEDCVAGVLAHETCHVAARHITMVLFAKQLLLILGIYSAYYFICQLLEKLIQKKTGYDLDDSLFKTTIGISSSIAAMFIKAVCGELRVKEREADIGGVFVAKEAGYNPLGIMKFCELRDLKTTGTLSAWFHKKVECVHTHPSHENRKLATLAAIMEIDPEALNGRVTYIPADTPNRYDIERSSPAIQFAQKVRNAYGANP